MGKSIKKQVAAPAMKKTAIERKIDFDANLKSEEFLAEIYLKSYQLLRLHRFTLRDRPGNYVNLRMWMIDNSEDVQDGADNANKYATKLGFVIPEHLFIKLIKYYLPETSE